MLLSFKIWTFTKCSEPYKDSILWITSMCDEPNPLLFFLPKYQLYGQAKSLLLGLYQVPWPFWLEVYLGGKITITTQLPLCSLNIRRNALKIWVETNAPCSVARLVSAHSAPMRDIPKKWPLRIVTEPQFPSTDPPSCKTETHAYESSAA